MRATVPDEQGWYWVELESGQWCMAFVSTNHEHAYFWDGDDPLASGKYRNLDELSDMQIVRWFGPLSCPGGPFGSHIIVASVEDHEQANREKKVIAIQHFDFRYCRDEGHGSSLTISGCYTREEAADIIQREVNRECGDA